MHQIFCRRHEDYVKGGRCRIKLNYQVNLCLFSENQLDFIMDKLMQLFHSTKSDVSFHAILLKTFKACVSLIKPDRNFFKNIYFCFPEYRLLTKSITTRSAHQNLHGCSQHWTRREWTEDGGVNDRRKLFSTCRFHELNSH